MSSKISPLTCKQRYTTQIKREQRATYLKLTIHETIKLSSDTMLYTIEQNNQKEHNEHITISVNVPLTLLK